MAVVHVKNIHNHKIKVGFRNEPLPPYFDGYVDTLSGNIVDPVSNVDTFLQSVKDEVDAKVGSIDDFIKSSQEELNDQTNQLSKFINDGQSDLDASKASVMDVVSSLKGIVEKNNSILIEYVFNNSQFAGKKEVSVTNGYSIDEYTAKFIKKIKVDLTVSIYETRNSTGHIEKESDWTYIDVEQMPQPYSYSHPYDNEPFSITIDFSDRSVHKVGAINGVDIYLDASTLTNDKIQLSPYIQYGSTIYRDSGVNYYQYDWVEHNVYCKYYYTAYEGSMANRHKVTKTGYTYRDVPFKNYNTIYFGIKNITLMSE